MDAPAITVAKPTIHFTPYPGFPAEQSAACKQLAHLSLVEPHNSPLQEFQQQENTSMAHSNVSMAWSQCVVIDGKEDKKDPLLIADTAGDNDGHEVGVGQDLELTVQPYQAPARQQDNKPLMPAGCWENWSCKDVIAKLGVDRSRLLIKSQDW